jgi:CBS domain containing-hemolysin-like protein
MEEPLRSYLYLVLAVGLVALNAFFTAAEFALVKMRMSRLEALVQRGNLFATSARHVVRHLDVYLSLTQLGITVASLGLGWIGEPAVADLLRPALVPLLGQLGFDSEAAVHSVAFVVAFSLITFVTIVIGELAPKMLAIQRTEVIALSVAVPLRILRIVFFPALWLLQASSNALLRLAGLDFALRQEIVHSEEELRIILAESARLGAVSGPKRRLLEAVFTFSGKTAQEVMIPRAEVVYVSLARTWPENLQIIRSSLHTRYPLCTLGLDHVIGMVHIKDLFEAGEEVKSSEDLVDKKREMLFIPEACTIEELQRQFQQRRMHMAVVVDEYGGTAGIVTLEDVLEELVGEIQDEFDREPPKIQKTAEGQMVDGLLQLSEVNAKLGLGLEEGEAHTMGGYITGELGRIARVGDRVNVNGRELRVVEMKGRRVAKVLVAPGPVETGGMA